MRMRLVFLLFISLYFLETDANFENLFGAFEDLLDAFKKMAVGNKFQQLLVNFERLRF